MLKRVISYVKDEEFRINIYKNKVNVVNYANIITLEDSRISLNYSKGIVVFKGDNLSINKLLDNELLITGNIKSIELEW